MIAAEHPDWASATVRLQAVSVLPVPPFGPSTVIMAPSPMGAAAPRLRAIAFSSENASSWVG